MSICVRNKVREIIEAQDQVENESNGGCTTSCDRSIQDLLAPSTNNRPRATTIPFTLTCKGTCTAFFGVGITDDFNAVQSPVFRANKFVDDSESCVQLELLVPVTAGGVPIIEGDTVPSYFANDITHLEETGLCITVDLDCFCAITCLAPTTPGRP